MTILAAAFSSGCSYRASTTTERHFHVAGHPSDRHRLGRSGTASRVLVSHHAGDRDILKLQATLRCRAGSS